MKAAKSLLGLTALFAIGCGGATSSLTGGAVSQRYVVEYDATQNLTLVSGRFVQDGESSELLPPASITANGLPIGFNPSTGTDYPYVGSLSGLTSVTLVFTDPQDNVYTNVASFTTLSSIGFPSTFGGFPQTGTVNFAWTGLPVQTGQTVALTITSASGLQREFRTTTVGATSLPVDAALVYGISGITATLRRYVTPALAQTSSTGGSIIVSYSTGAKTIVTTAS